MKVKKYFFTILLLLIIISEVSSISSTLNASYKKNSIVSDFQPQPAQLTTINDLNASQSEGNLSFITHQIYSKNVQLINSEGIQSTLLNITSAGILGFNFSSFNNSLLPQITYSFTDLNVNSTLLNTYQTNASTIHDEIPIVSVPAQILFNISVTDKPTIFPLNISLIFWMRDVYTIPKNSNFQGYSTYPNEAYLFKLTPQLNYNQLAFSFSGSYVAKTLYNESGSIVWINGGNYYHWLATHSETYFLAITTNNFPDLSYLEPYQALFRVSSPNIHLNLSANTTSISDSFLYPGDNINLTFNLLKNYQIRFTENGSRQYWDFWNNDQSQSYWQNWHVNGIFLTWDPLTISQVINTPGNYSLQLTQQGSFQFRIKITLHYMPINLSNSNTYSGSIVGTADYELWTINLQIDDEFSLMSSGTKFQLHVLDSNYNLVQASMIGESLNYTVSQSGTYFIEVQSGGLQGSYTLQLTVTAPSSRNADYGVPLLVIFCFAIVFFLFIKSRSKIKK